MNQLLFIMRTFVLLVSMFAIQGCGRPVVTELTKEESSEIILREFGSIASLTIVSGKKIKGYSSDQFVVKFTLAETMTPSDWIKYLIQQYTETNSKYNMVPPFHPINEFQYRNDIDGKGSDIVTITYYESERVFEYDSYIYY